MKRLRLDGLTALPGQVWGAVRLVPLVRERPFDSLLRLHPQIYEIAPAAVRLNRPTVHQSYIPHGIVAQWSEGDPYVKTVGTRLTDPRRPAAAEVRGKPRAERRTVRRPSGNRLRFLPLHLSMEGYLSLHFGGPSMAWDEWSRLGLDEGPPPQVETAYPGKAVTGLGDALRVFEIHPEQCGMLIFVADALAGAFAVPHPEDYRLLHPTLVEDLYGELIWQYALFHGDVPDFGVRLREDEVHTVADLRAAVTAAVEEWGRFQLGTMAEGLLGADYRFDEVYAMGPYRLWRFQPRFEPRRETHIGEAITDEEGRLAYLHTFRLSEKQIRRGRLFDELADHDGRLEETAAAMGIDVTRLIARIDRAGFGHLLRQDVLDHHRARLRR